MAHLEETQQYDMTLYNCNIVNVVDAVILQDKCIVIDKGKIVKIDENSNYNSHVESSRNSFDCQDSYVMPGLIDCHVHVTAFTASFALLEKTAPSYVTARASQCLRQMLDRGFTTVRDAGGADHGLGRAIEEGLVVGPRLLFCGRALSQTGGHGDMRGPGDNSGYKCFGCMALGRVCDGDAQVRQATRDEIRKGATHIKVMAGGGVSSPTDRITSTQFSIQELTAIVEEANAANLYVMAHAYTPRAILNGIKAGVRSIEHGNLLDEESAQAMAAAGTYLVPTLATYDVLAKEGLDEGLSEENVKKVADVREAGKRSIGIAEKAGVKMCFGTDLLAGMQRHQLRGLSLLEESGMSPPDVVRTATCNAAQLLRMENEIGIIAEGANADILVVSENPLLSTKVLEDCEKNHVAILKGGQIHFAR